MKQTYETKHIGDMAFEMILDEHHKITMDAKEEVGGKDLGPRPKQLIITALTGCSGMDVVSILKKMRVDFDSFVIEVETQASDEHPKVYTDIHIIYKFEGKDLEENRDKFEKAIDLSQERYCGVSAMLRKATNLTHELKLIEK
ncbi:MAG: OsmC family protein [Clostridia bacterium]